MKKYFIYTLLSYFLLDSTAFSEEFIGRTWVIDGDSLRITLKNGIKKEVRLFGINAPELSSPAGRRAKKHLIRLIKTGGRTVKCKVYDIDKYKRNVSVCHNEHGDLAERMILDNHANIFTRYIHKAPKKIKERYIKAMQNRSFTSYSD